MYTLYILLCDKTQYYVGITDDLGGRLEQHVQHDSFFTKRYTTVEVVYTETYQDRSTAAKRERQIKGWSKAKKAALIRGDISSLKKLSKSKRVV